MSFLQIYVEIGMEDSSGKQVIVKLRKKRLWMMGLSMIFSSFKHCIDFHILMQGRLSINESESVTSSIIFTNYLIASTILRT